MIYRNSMSFQKVRKSQILTNFNNKLSYILQPYVSPEMKRIKLKIKLHFGKEVHISIIIIVYTLNKNKIKMFMAIISLMIALIYLHRDHDLLLTS